ncbi:MAG: DUF952 domain-containing protein [Pseudomonadota bacterium]
MLIYKIFRRAEWDALVANGQTRGAPIDIEDGYIHFSTAETVEETAVRHFQKEKNLIVVTVLAKELGHHLKWEASRGGMLFPHLYGALRYSDVKTFHPLVKDEGGFVFEGIL